MEHENDIKEALDFVSPSALTYEEWLMVGMGLKEAGLPVTVWEQWSARDGGRYHKLSELKSVPHIVKVERPGRRAVSQGRVH